MHAKTFTEPAREIPVAADVDVLGIGGGSAGVPAAIAAARKGMDTLLVERNGFLGGTAVASLVDVFVESEGRAGFFEELLARLERLGGLSDHGFLEGVVLRELGFDPELMKHALDQLTDEAGVRVLFHTLAATAIVEGSTVKGVIIENKAGRQAIFAKRIIDCSADGDIAASAGAEFQIGRPQDGLSQAATVVFRLGNVRHPEWVPAGEGRWRKGSFDERTMQTLLARLEEAKSSPKYGNSPMIQTGAIARYLHSLGKRVTPRRDTETTMIMVRVLGVNGVDPWDLSRAEKEGRRQALELSEFYREHVPGCENSYLLDTGTHVGIRATRRILGDYVLVGDDVRQCRKFPDAIARCSFYIDVWQPDSYHPSRPMVELIPLPKGDWYDIPYRCLLPRGLENLLVAGRCISADYEAQASVRIQIPCIAMGQAAGTAAALSLQSGVTPRRLDVTALQAALAQDRGAAPGGQQHPANS